MMTAAGMILGTAPYMAPEQAKGREADKRSDLWAFGCVLYEMLTGTRAFDGADVSETLAAVLMRDPEWGALPPGVPPAMRVLLKRCLEKDRRKRIGDVAAALFVLDEATTLGATDGPAEAGHYVRGEGASGKAGLYGRRGLGRRAMPVVAAVVLTAAVTGAGAWWATRPAPPRIMRTTITASGAAALTISGGNSDLAITPDGSRVVYAGNNGTQLFVRAVDALEPVAIATGAIGNVFMSPDGQWVGFGGTTTGIYKVSMSGGPSIQITPITDGRGRGATWTLDDTIVFATDVSPRGFVSPDGRWLAYESDASGRFEVYVRPFPNVADGQWQVSTGGGIQPLWARNASELFFLAADGALSAVSVEARGASWSAGGQTKILEPRYFTGGLGASTTGRTYDVSPDGRRFLMIKQGGSGDQASTPPQIIVVQHWFEELRRLVPVN